VVSLLRTTVLRQIDRYLIRSFLTPFAIALTIFTFIQLVPFLVRLVEPLIAKGVPTPTILRAMATLLPSVLAITIPMSLLVALLIGLGRLSGDREWVALQSCGVSAFRLIRPVAFVSIVAWALTSWVLIWGVPNANQAYREITFGIAAERAEGEVRPRVFFENLPKSVLYVRDVPTTGGGWDDVFLADTANPDSPVIYLARHGRMVLDRIKRTVELVLEDGTQHQSQAGQPEDYSVVRFERLVLNVDPSQIFPTEGPEKGDNEMTVAELRASIADRITKGLSTHNPTMAIQKKFSIPVACLVFGLLALVLGLTTRRDGGMASFAVGVGVIFAYYVLMWTSQSAAKGGQVPAWLAMWIPNIVLVVPGIVALLARGPWSRRWGRVALVVRLTFARVWSPGTLGRLSRRLGAAMAARRRTARAQTSMGGWRPSRLMPSLLDAYVAKLYLRIAGLSFVALMGIFYISTFIDLSDKLFKGKTTGAGLLRYMYYASPQFIYYCIPIGILIAGLVTVGLLTRSSELIVMRACGISLYRSALPLVLLALGASVLLFFFDDNVLAYSNRKAEALRHEIRVGSPRTFDVLNRQWIVGREGEIYNYAFYDTTNFQLNNFSVFKFAPKAWRLQARTFYRSVRYSGAPTTGQEPKVTWDARDGWTREFDRQVEARGFRTAVSSPLALEPPNYFATEQPDADRMTYRDLRYYIAELRASGFNVVKYEVALHRKLSFPWVTVIMTLIAIPFAVTTGRKGAMYGIGLGVALALAYWVATSVFIAIGQGGAIAPVLAAWAPNLLFGAFAAYLLLTVRT
jgi:LPS export ABC transporter permease LptF/LPS export ABC transporter permease LptG